MEEIRSVFARFLTDGTVLSVRPYGNGHINDTFLAETDRQKYILQRVNHTVFPDMAGLMENVAAVSAHIAKKHPTAEIIPLREGGLYCEHDGDYFRVTTFMEGETPDKPACSDDMYLAGLAFGGFQKDMADFDAERLIDVIVGFHDTEKRLASFERAVAEDILGRKSECGTLIDAYLSKKAYASAVVPHLKSGEMPYRVTHNDTKFNNVILDRRNRLPVCVIDLDTVMKGSLLYDFGDAVRSGGKKAAEDEGGCRNCLDLDYFRAFCQGFLQETREMLTDKERELLFVSPILMTYECGMRFLTDYLQGDGYFRPKAKGLNLLRAQYHMEFVQDMEQKQQKMKEIIDELL